MSPCTVCARTRKHIASGVDFSGAEKRDTREPERDIASALKKREKARGGLEDPGRDIVCALIIN